MSRLACIASLAFVILFSAASESHAGDAADAELKALAERAAQAKDIDKLRQDIFAFRQRHRGTTHAVQAAGLLRDLPSPLDKLSASAIPAIEKFDWHPKETVAILGEHRGRQGGQTTALAWSKNGKWIASTSTNGYVRIWDAATMRLLHTLGHGQGAYSVTFSKDSALLAHGGGDGQVRVWEMLDDAKPPKEKGTYKVSSTPLTGLGLAPDKKWFVTGGGDARLYYWDLTQDPPREITGANAHTGGIHAIALSNDGKTIGSAGADKNIRLWFVNTQNQMKEKGAIEAHAGAVHCLTWHPLDDKTIASGGADGAIRIWGIVDGKSLKVKTTFKGKGGIVHAVAYSPSGKTLAAAFGDGTIRTYAVGAGSVSLTEKTIYDGHNMLASGVVFSPDGNTLASSSHDWTVRQWPGPANAGKQMKDKTVKSGHFSHVYALAFSPDEKGIASGSYDTSTRFWEVGAAEAKERTPPMKGDGHIYTLVFAPDGKSLVSGGQATKFRSFDVSTGKLINFFQGHTGYVNRLAYSPDGANVASSATDKSLRLWNAKTGQGIDSINAFETYVNSVGYSPDGKHLLCTSGYYLYDKNSQIVIKDGKYYYLDATVRLFDAGSTKEIFRWKSDTILPGVLTFTPDSKHFLVGASDSLLRRWPTAMPPKEGEVYYKGANYGVTVLACSPDGRWLASWGPDYQINLYELDSGKKVRNWTTGEQFGTLAFSQDSRHLAVGVGTGVVMIWRLESRP